MYKKYFTRIAAIMMTASLLFSSVPVSASEVGAATTNTQTTGDTQTSTATYNPDSYVNESIANNYTNVSKNYTASLYQGDPYEIAVDKAFVSGTGSAALTEDNNNYKNPVVSMTIGDTVTFSFDVPEAGQYFYRFDYMSNDKSTLPAELSMKLNGTYPFYEARRLLFESTWVSKAEKSYDRYNNEIVTIPDKLVQWESKYLFDASYRYSTPLILELQKGHNEVTLNVSEGSILLGNMYLEKVTQTPEYTSSEAAPGSELITIQGEDFKYRNDSSIRSVAEFDTAVAPYKVSETVLNTIDKDSFKDPGQKVTYEFTVEKAGYYNVGLNYIQSDKNGFPVFLDVAIDGAVPNTAFKAYHFDYTTKYKTISLQDGSDKNLSVYLEEGTHTISFTINIDNVRQVLEGVSKIMSEINDLSLEITKVAGTNKDKYRDLKLTKYIPDLESRLNGWVDELNVLRDSVKQYSSNVDNIACFSYIKVASGVLTDLAKNPDDIPYRVGELSTSTNSANQYLANMIDNLNKNRLSIDRIYLYQDSAKLPSKIGFFSGLFMSVKRFVSSFFNQSYSTSNVNKNHLQVWVSRPRQYVEIMQKMIDEQFTPQTGIQVDLSVITDANKLILANSSGNAPDIATGINYAIPFDLAIRGALKDLTEFDDFKEIANRYQAGLHIPATIGDGIYALPETMNFWVLFYRTDILDKLGLKVPDTIDDVVNMLPELQMRGLNFYYPTAGMTAMRNFHGTTPLLFQNGGSLYGTYAGDTTLNSEASIKGITQLTELFTIYNLPVDIPNFYQHFRNGDIPIGIADYSAYNLILNAAPEIAESWDIAPMPGVKDANGNVLRYSAGGAESTVLFKSNEDREKQAWEFMKWWSSADVQSEYGQTLQISYGDEYMWNTANLEAFKQLPWDSQDKEVIMEQSTWVMEAPRILGTYMLEREYSNAFNDIVVNGKTLRTRIDKAVKVINRETERKLEEFGYIKNGKVVKEYTVPNIDTVNRILGKTN
ncbi:MAG TPA: extracellular solute-binding protein [Mobilitalea sp.]|nr:extracellular solute-binding protein [Mobilitalea sp.]